MYTYNFGLEFYASTWEMMETKSFKSFLLYKRGCSVNSKYMAAIWPGFFSTVNLILVSHTF